MRITKRKEREPVGRFLVLGTVGSAKEKLLITPQSIGVLAAEASELKLTILKIVRRGAGSDKPRRL